MKRPSVHCAVLFEPLTVVAALLSVLSSSGASQQVVWKSVTPPDMPDFGRVSLIDASAFDAGKAYVTFDDGGWWQELNPGLPDIPVTDVIPEHDELAMASHGRGFWVLDSVGPLREYRPGVPGWGRGHVRTGGGVLVGERGGDLVVGGGLHCRGGEERSGVGPQAGDHGRGRERVADVHDSGGGGGAGPVVESGPPGGSGLEPAVVDLRIDPAATFPGMVLWGVRTMPQMVPPAYRARLGLGVVSTSLELVVKRNPWTEGVTDEDLVAQYEFGVEIRNQVDRPNRAVIEIRDVTAQLEGGLERVDDEGLVEAGERLRAALDVVEGEIYQVRNRSNQDALNSPIKVNNRLANLQSMSERGDGRPGSGMYGLRLWWRGWRGCLLLAVVWWAELVGENR